MKNLKVRAKFLSLCLGGAYFDIEGLMWICFRGYCTCVTDHVFHTFLLLNSGYLVMPIQ
jgi:hypothetical protein